MTLLKAARALVESCPSGYPYAEHFRVSLNAAVPFHLRRDPETYDRAEQVLLARAWVLAGRSRRLANAV